MDYTRVWAPFLCDNDLSIFEIRRKQIEWKFRAIKLRDTINVEDKRETKK